MFKGTKEIEQALYALSEQLAVEGIEHLEIVVCGAAALFNLQWYIRDRSTEDVDIISFVNTTEDGSRLLQSKSHLWKKVRIAARRVAKDFDLKENWLNRGAVFITDMGLPEGIMERVDTRNFGKNLIVHFVGRQDLISLKLFAYLGDIRRPDVHADDLIEINPTDQEMEQAARWCMELNDSPDVRNKLKDSLIRLRYRDVAGRL